MNEDAYLDASYEDRYDIGFDDYHDDGGDLYDDASHYYYDEEVSHEQEQWVDKVENAWDDLEFAQALRNKVRIKRAQDQLHQLYENGSQVPGDWVRQFLGLGMFTRTQIEAIRRSNP